MKRVTITADAHVPGDTPEQPTVVFAGSTLDLDDTVAGLLVVSGKARYDKEGKVKDNSKARLAEPLDAQMAALVAAAVQAALASKPAPAAT
jgi:hypothetical protein